MIAKVGTLSPVVSWCPNLASVPSPLGLWRSWLGCGRAAGCEVKLRWYRRADGEGRQKSHLACDALCVNGRRLCTCVNTEAGWMGLRLWAQGSHTGDRWSLARQTSCFLCFPLDFQGFSKCSLPASCRAAPCTPRLCVMEPRVLLP